MDTSIPSQESAGTLFNPLAGWEAASRWNAATFDMVARAWQQWLALVTVLPQASRSASANPRDASPPARSEEALSRSTREHATAQREPRNATRRAAPKRPARAKSKPRARG